MANGGKGKEVKYRLGSNTTGQIRFDARYSRYLPSDGDNSEGEDATSEEDDSDARDLSSVSGGHAPTRKRKAKTASGFTGTTTRRPRSASVASLDEYHYSPRRRGVKTKRTRYTKERSPSDDEVSI